MNNNLRKTKIVCTMGPASLKDNVIEEMLRKRGELYLNYSNIVLNEGGILESRNILDSEPEIQLGALYLELLKAFEKRVYSKYSG